MIEEVRALALGQCQREGDDARGSGQAGVGNTSGRSAGRAEEMALAGCSSIWTTVEPCAVLRCAGAPCCAVVMRCQDKGQRIIRKGFGSPNRSMGTSGSFPEEVPGHVAGLYRGCEGERRRYDEGTWTTLTPDRTT